MNRFNLFCADQYQRKRTGLTNWCWLIDRVFFWKYETCMMAWVKCVKEGTISAK